MRLFRARFPKLEGEVRTLFDGASPGAAVITHPGWCEEEECSVQPRTGGTHASRRVLIPDGGLRATALFVEQSTDGLRNCPARVVVTVMRAGVEGPVQRWSYMAGRAVHAAMGDLLALLAPDPVSEQG